MHRFLFIMLTLTLAAAPLCAAPKAKAKNDRPATAPLPKVPDKIESAVQLTGHETPDQIAKAYADGLHVLLPAPGTNFTDNALLKFQAMVHNAARPGAEAERVACCQAIAAALGTGLTRETKAQLLRELTFVGKAEVVPVLDALLTDKDDPILREYARSALAHNPALDAAEVLVMHHGAQSPAGTLLSPEVKADSELISAYLCLRYGRTAEADAIFQRLNQPQQPRQVRFAALRGTLTSAGDNAVPKMLALLAGSDADGRTVALGQIKLLGAPGRNTLIAGLDQLPAPVRGIVVESLANLDEKAVLPVALTYLNHADANLRAVGLTALARLGDAASVPVIVQALAQATTPADRSPFEAALIRLPGADAAEAAMADALKGATGDTQRSLLAVLGKRSARSALPAVLAATGAGDAQTVKAAYRALTDLAAAEDVPVLLAKVAAAPADVRGEAENAAAKALLKIDKAGLRTPAVLAAFGQSPDMDKRRSQLRLLRDCGDAQALAAVQAALTDPEPRIREAALRALSEWPDAAAWDALAPVYAQPEKEQFRILALRGLVRQATALNDRPDAKLMERYGQLFAGAKTDGDRKLILGALGGCATPAAVDLAIALRSNPGIRAEVEATVKKIADAMKKQHPADAKAALQKLKQAKP